MEERLELQRLLRICLSYRAGVVLLQNQSKCAASCITALVAGLDFTFSMPALDAFRKIVGS